VTLSSRLRIPLELLVLALAAALTVGAAVGLRAGWGYAAAGFPWLTVAAAADAVARFLAGALVYLGLYWAGFFLLRRGRPGVAPAAVAAAALAAAPFGLAWAYLFNQRRALRPADLLEPHGLVPNLGLLAAFLGCLALACALLVPWTRRRLLAARRPPVAAALLLAGLAALLHLAPAARARLGAPGPERPHVIVLLVDALRADHLGCYGYGRATSPAIDELARDGVVFEQAISQSTFTKSSIASLSTGRSPYEHGVYWGDRRDTADRLTSDVLPAAETTLAEVLRGRGYLTAAWVQNSHLRSYMGFAQGFVSYRDQQGDAGRITRRFLRWLRGPAARHELFAYLHYIDLHDPYLPEPPYDRLFGGSTDVYQGVDLDEWGAYLEGVRSGRIELSAPEVARIEALYDGQIRALDDRIGRLLAELEDSGLYERSLIVLTSDHGDGFMEHGFISHSSIPYEELVRVPLIVKLPALRHSGRRVDRQVRSIDVLPTVLDLLGIPIPRRVSGCSLVPLLEGRPDPAGGRRACDLAVTEIAEREGVAPTLGLRADGFKYIRGPGGEELYDLTRDPGETRDLATAADPARLAAFRGLADDIEARRARSRAGSVVLDEKTIRELKALGYVE
jgi:arylsulfatase A-like enzyme